jgi:hypothetical protein
VDVYFQNGLNADLKFKKLNGGIYTDFEVTALPQTVAGGQQRREVCLPLGPQDGRARGQGRTGAVLRHAERQHPAALQNDLKRENTMRRYSALLGMTLMVCSLGLAQDAGSERVVVPARNTTHARKVDVNLMGGSITVKSYAGKEVIVEARGDGRRAERDRDRDKAPTACSASIFRSAACRWKKRTTW